MQVKSEIDALIEQLDKRLETLRELGKTPDCALILKETLESLGKELEIAIQNARLQEALANRVQELTALQEIAKAITSTVDLPENLQKMTASAVNLVGGDAFSSSLYLYDRDKDEFRPGAAAGEIDVEFLEAHRPRNHGIAREALRKRQPILSADPNRIDPRMREYGAKAVVSFPLITERGPVGLLYVYFRTTHGGDLTASEKRVLTTFADQAAIAIENAQLFEQRAEEMALERIIAEQRAASISSIGGVFAHRMGNLAGWIPDTVREIRKRINTDDKYLMDNLDLLEWGARRLLKMAESLERLGKAGPPELVEINSLLALVPKLVKIPESIEVTQDYASDLPLIRADRAFLLEVFVNLITNAIEAMPQGGRLDIRSRFSDEKWIEVEVTDTGCGMSEKVVQESLFTPFYSTKPGRGMGIGLWGSILFIRKLGGDILVKSKEGEGSTFTVRLPATE